MHRDDLFIEKELAKYERYDQEMKMSVCRAAFTLTGGPPWKAYFILARQVGYPIPKKYEHLYPEKAQYNFRPDVDQKYLKSIIDDAERTINDFILEAALVQDKIECLLSSLEDTKLQLRMCFKPDFDSSR